jgi:transcriptional regulator with XRE-family HTH domain
MNTKFKNRHTVSKDFENIFAFKTKEEEIYHESRMIMFRFLSEIEKLCASRNMKKKDLAEAIGTSPSYVTQLFNGDKLLNLETIAKLQKVFNVVFSIEVESNVAKGIKEYINPTTLTVASDKESPKLKKATKTNK